MKVIIIIQKKPFYLAENIKFLIESLPSNELKTYFSFPKRDDVIRFLKGGNRFF